MTSGDLILLVDDIPDHIAAYQYRLAEHGFRVRLARSGRDALELVREALPRCAVIDLRLPDMSGWELCRTIKSREGWNQLPIIVLTPDLSRTCAADSARSGCNAWLAHPTVAEDLIQTIRRVLSLETADPMSNDAALIGLTSCAACGSDQVRATLRMSPIQYYCCRACGFCWRAETLQAATSSPWSR